MYVNESPLCIQRVDTLRQTMQQKFSEQRTDGVRLGFKLPDGTKVEYTFPNESTVKVKNALCLTYSILWLLISLHSRICISTF